MLNFAVVTCDKWINGDTKQCIFLGNYQEDGYIYFNDDMFYRCTMDKENLQIYYPQNNIWIRTDILDITNIFSFNARAAQNTVNGGGGVAPNANVETAVQWAIQKASSGQVTYSQGVRNLNNPDGYSYDCSSFVITAFYVGGFDGGGAAYDTTTMKDVFINMGFEWIPGSYFEASDLLRGDIQLNTLAGNDGHTNIYIGNNQDVDCGGNDAAIIQHTPNDFGSGWHGILRYRG